MAAQTARAGLLITGGIDMTYDEIKEGIPDVVTCIYWDVTQEEIDACPVDHWMGQTRGTYYLGTQTEVEALDAKRLLAEGA